MKQLEIYKKYSDKCYNFTLELLSLLNNVEVTNGNIIKEILYKIKQFTNVDAAGIRMKEDADYPYYEAIGFSKEFLEKENILCSLSAEGELIKDNDGKPVLECMCGVVIQDKTDSSETFFTEGGSFWTNNNSDLGKDYLTNKYSNTFRFTCAKKGYKSVAIIPIYADNEIIGLLQLNDKKADAFNLDLIEKFEKIANILGIILKRKELKFTGQDGKIKVSIYNDRKQEYVFISVKDTGMGIKEDMKKVIFDKLNRVDDSFSRDNEGLGVGLTIVKEIVKLHGGEVILESEYGKGSEFIIKIPDKMIASKLNEPSAYIYNDINIIEVEFADIYEI